MNLLSPYFDEETIYHSRRAYMLSRQVAVGAFGLFGFGQGALEIVLELE